MFDLALVREKKNITQQKLSEKVGVTRQMISAIENGAKPSIYTAKKIASTLEFDWTLFFKEEPKPTAM